MSKDRDAYWSNTASWPDDAYGFVFLARALHTAGAALYGDSWTGFEPITPAPIDLWQEINGHKFLKARENLGPGIEIQALSLLRKYHPERVELEDAPLKGSSLANKVMTPDTWLAAVKVVEEENERRRAALDRLAGVQDWLKVAIRDGELRYVLLPLVGGRFSGAMPPEWWNRKSTSSIFFWCQINPKNPFTSGVGGDDFQHVFVEEAGLNQLIRALSFPKGDPLMLANPFDDLPDFSDPEQTQDEWVPPDPADFAVMEMDDWTIEMVLAWIIWRDAAEVVRFYRDYHKLLTSPFESQFSSIPAPTLDGLQDLLAWNAHLKDFGTPDRSHFTYSGALKELKSSLRNGDVVADGTDLHSMAAHKIGSDEWKRLNPIVSDNGTAILVNNLNVPIYGDLLFERQHVVEKWPADLTLRTIETHDVEGRSVQPSQGIIDRIREEGGVAKLSGGERQIWDAIQAIGGESSLPARRADYIDAIRKAARGTIPSDSSIDRFFARFKPKH